MQDWIGKNVTWSVQDARNPALADILGPQDIVIANNFLIHMVDREAEECLRGIVRLVTPGGYLLVWGIDPNVKIRLARDLGLKPVPEMLEEVREADQAALHAWPWKYWGIEPLKKGRADWILRYSSAFQAP